MNKAMSVKSEAPRSPLKDEIQQTDSSRTFLRVYDDTDGSEGTAASFVSFDDILLVGADDDDEPRFRELDRSSSFASSSAADAVPSLSTSSESRGSLLESVLSFHLAPLYEDEDESEGGPTVSSDEPTKKPYLKPGDSEKQVKARVRISRFTEVSYTYPSNEYDRSSVPMAFLTDDQFEELDREHAMMQLDYREWMEFNQLIS